MAATIKSIEPERESRTGWSLFPEMESVDVDIDCTSRIFTDQIRHFLHTLMKHGIRLNDNADLQSDLLIDMRGKCPECHAVKNHFVPDLSRLHF